MNTPDLHMSNLADARKFILDQDTNLAIVRGHLAQAQETIRNKEIAEDRHLIRIYELRAACDDQQKSLADKCEVIENLQKSNAILDKRISDLNNIIDSYKTTTSDHDLQAGLVMDLRIKLDRLQAAYDKVHRNLAAEQRTAESRGDLYRETQIALTATQKELAVCKDHKAAAKTVIDSQHAELESLRRDIHSSRLNCEEWSGRAHSMEDRCTKLTEKIGVLSARITEREVLCGDLRATVESYKKENIGLRREVASVNNHFIRLAVERDAETNRANGWKSKYEVISDKLKERNETILRLQGQSAAKSSYPPVPDGYSHWVARGIAWCATGVKFAYKTKNGEWHVPLSTNIAVGSPGTQYLEAIPIPLNLPEGCPPPPPIPEGYSHWVYRGKEWRGDQVKYTFWYSHAKEWAISSSVRNTCGDDCHYLEAIK